MKKFLAALLLWLALASAAHAQVTYDQTLNVDAYADNAVYGTTEMQATYTGHLSLHNNSQGTSKSTFVVSNATSGGTACQGGVHKCIEFFIPINDLGGNFSTYGAMGYTATADAATILNLEWDQLYETGFDLHSLGKQPLSLNVWDAVDATHRTHDVRTNWQCEGTHTATTCSTGTAQFVTYEQDNANNGHDGCVSDYRPWPILTNTWYHFHQQVDQTDVLHPIFKVWIKRPTDGAEVLVFNCTWTPPAGGVTPSHSIQFGHNSWFGGAGSNDKALNDSRQLQANIHLYTAGAPPADTTPPSVPTGIFASTAALPPDSASTQALVTWNASTDDTSVAGYHVKRDTTIVCTTSSLSCLDTVNYGETHTYTVNAFDAVPNNSAYSTGSTITMIDTTPPTVPTGLLATVNSSTQITPSWTASTNYYGHPTTYHVRRGGSVVYTGTATSFADTGLTASTQYSYTVDAMDNAVSPNTSAQSGAVLATTSGGGGDVTAPTVPGNFHTTSVGANFIAFAWTPSTDDTAVAGYPVTCGGSVVATVVSPSYTYSGLAPSTAYTCSVQAKDAVPNISAKTSDLVVTTLANTNFAIMVPQALTAHFTTGP